MAAVFQHKYEKVLPTAILIGFAMSALNECDGQPVAFVLKNAAELTIFHHEVTPRNTIPAHRLAILDDPSSFWADTRGKLWLMTYAQLSHVLAVPGAGPTGDLTLLLHMGCGEYTWDMVHTCHQLWQWAWAVDGPIIWVYTISNIEQKVEGPRIEWQKPEVFDAAISQLHREEATHRELLGVLKSQGSTATPPMRANRAVLFTPEAKLLQAFRQLNLQPPSYVQLRGDMDELCLDEWTKIFPHREPACDPKMVVVGTDVGIIGTVRDLGMVLVVPVREGLCMDPRVSQVVFGEDIPMSKAEMRYACRVACTSGDKVNKHVVSMFTSRDEFGKLAPAPTDPMAFTADLPAVLLLFCRNSYFDDGDKTPPIRLPVDKEMTSEYLRRLDLRGLTEGHGGRPTELGELTAWWHHEGGCRNFDVANLLAIAQVAQGDRASALVQIAAMLYHPDCPLRSPLATFLRFQGQDLSTAIARLCENEIDGFAEPYVARGPIWIAIAIWAWGRRRISQLEESPVSHLSQCDDMLQVPLRGLFMVQRTWEGLGHTWTRGTGCTPLVHDPTISEADFLYLEECIVRVWMHKLVLVCTAGSGLGAFAYDLASGHPIQRPPGDPVNWGWLTVHQDADHFDGMPFIGVFAVYTVLHRSTGHDGRIVYTPETLTYVSARAVRHVLRDVAASKTKAGQRPPNWQNLLRTEYPCCEEADEETS